MKLNNKNLLNADSCAFFYSPEVWQPEGGPYSPKAIENQIKLIADSGIDTYIINPNTQMPWYPSKHRDYVFKGYQRGDREFFRGHGICQGTDPDKMDAFLDQTVAFANLYLDLKEQGIDWFEETERACRRCGIAPWISIRMNDTHGGNIPELSYMNAEIFKRDPSIRLNKPCIYPWDSNHRYAFDYSQQRVRDYMFDMIKECVEEYSYEGLELDFLRDPILLSPVASKEDTEMITSWIAGIRRLTIKKSQKTGRPFPLGIRSCGHLNLMRDMGLDIRALAKKGLIDFASFSNFWQTSWDMDYTELRKELGEEITLYGVIEGGPNWLKTKAESSHLDGFVDIYHNSGDRLMNYEREMIRGNAAGKLVLGADGIELFNNFFSWDTKRFPMAPAYDALRFLYDLDYLRGKEKHYCLSTQYRSPYTTVPFETVETLPELIEPDTRRGFRIPMCREPLDEGLRLIVQVICEKKDEEPKLGITFNNNWPDFNGIKTSKLLFPCGIYTDITDNCAAYNFEVDPSLLKDGYNHICVFNGEKQTSDQESRWKNIIRVLSVEAAIKK